VAPGDTARLYHRLTSYESEGWDWDVKVDHQLVLQDFVANDFATWPAACKSYAGDLPVVALPREWTDSEGLDLAALARILYLSAGVVRVVEREDRPTLLLRAAGSAGGRFPYELYVAARDGVHWYDPVNHALRQVGPPPGGEATTLILTGVPWRTGWRYSERGLRHIYWDAGTVLAQTLALATTAGLAPRLWTAFPDEQVTRLVGADGTHEFPLALVTLGDGAPAIEPGGEAATGAIDTRAPLEFPLVTLAQHAGDQDRLGDPWPPPPPPPDDVEAVILRRGSTRIMDPEATIGRDVFTACLEAALSDAPVTEFIAVHAVEDQPPGLYRWPDLETPLRAGAIRDEVFRLCMEQELGRDAAFVVMAAADLDALDDHGYREAQLGAGLANGRLHLAAFARGIGASGMTFYDSAIADFLGEPLAGLLFTCVGVPAYRNRRGGAPGAPAAIVYPTRR
jgi:hypothetical protein